MARSGDRATTSVVWRYLVDPTESIEADKPVINWRVDVIYLRKGDWKYEKSAAGETGGGRTHTFGVRRAGAKLKGCAIYRRSDIVLSHGKPIPKNGNGGMAVNLRARWTVVDVPLTAIEW